MTEIPQETVDATWQSVAALSPRRGNETMQRAAREQPALLGFVLAYTEDLSPGAHGLAVYLYTVVWQIFERAHGRRVPRIKTRTVEEALHAGEQSFRKLEHASEAFLQRAAVVQVSRQPHVFRYITEAIVEAPGDPEDPIDLTEDEGGTLFFVLKIVVELLDGACTEGPANNRMQLTKSAPRQAARRRLRG